jgi:hypothetical protein
MYVNDALLISFYYPTEVLRMYPPAMFLPRECTKPFKLETHSGTSFGVEVGTPVIIPVYALHYDPHHFHDPMTFDPDRFSEENKKNLHKYVYLPFGNGPRMCLGTYKDVRCAVTHCIWRPAVTCNMRTAAFLSTALRKFRHKCFLWPSAALILPGLSDKTQVYTS